MVLVKILQRKDAASLVVAIAVAMALNQFVSAVAFPLTFKLVGSDNEFGAFTGTGWKQEYLNPLVAFVIQLVLLEVVARLALAGREAVVKNRPR